ncbi:MAG: polysaccharide biosynthesis C-terminal domain-containing protein, partial [Candidatus Heimdallarchaeota archaeon]
FSPLLIGIGHTFTLQILVPLELDSLTAKIYGSAAILNTVLCFIFIPMFGYIGLCVIILITRIMIIILSFIAIRKNEVKLNLIKFKNNDST